MVTQAQAGIEREAGAYDTLLSQLEAERVCPSPPWLSSLRASALEELKLRGLPNSHDEDWRFTPLTPQQKIGFRPAIAPVESVTGMDSLDSLTFASLPGPRLVLVNGFVVPSLCSLEGLPESVVFGSLAETLRHQSESVRPHLGQLAPFAGNGFTAMNTAFFGDGAYLKVPEGMAVEPPLHLVFVKSPGPDTTVLPRNLLLLGRGARATVLESYFSIGSSAHFTNPVTEIHCEEESELELLKFQDENESSVHIATIAGTFGRRSRSWLHSFSLGSRLCRNNIRAHLGGEGLECVLNGLYVTRGDQVADHHMIVEHAEPHCASHEYFNGILDQRSRGVFHGRILVKPAAQKTDAKQTNKNILLSDDAVAYAKPQLEIYADDVKCTHGATIGQLNEDAIFYLRSRGIGQNTARQMLIHAFAGEIIDRVQHVPAREVLDQLVWERLERNLQIHRRT